MNEILVPLPPAELIDRLVSCQLCAQDISDPSKQAQAVRQRDVLQMTADATLPKSAALTQLRDSLFEVNADMMTVSTDLRAAEAEARFGTQFIALVQSIHALQDQRDDIKTRINALLEGF